MPSFINKSCYECEKGTTHAIQALPVRENNQFLELQEFLSNLQNFKNYRNELAHVEPPVVPFLGSHSMSVRDRESSLHGVLFWLLRTNRTHRSYHTRHDELGRSE